jgi:hypothetical protein
LNRVFFSGDVKGKPRVAYTVKGEKVVMFPLRVDEGAFDIDVIFVDREGAKGFEDQPGKKVIVSGTLTSARIESQNVFKVRANQIIWMEE